MGAIAGRARARESGQALVLYALMILAMIGMLALVLDLGFLFGQRRFDQNGADAAALAAARLMAGRVALGDQGVYFDAKDAEIYAKVREYAGLPAGSSSVPTGINQNPGLSGRNQLVVMLEYWSGVDGAGWCYSPAAGAVSGGGGYRTPAVPPCVLYVDGRPPRPGPSPYRVRVTVSSTHDSFFASAVGLGGAGPVTPQTDPASAACTRSGDGLLTCAQAVGMIAGSASTVGQGSVLPVTICDGDVLVSGTPPYTLQQLWGNFADPNLCDYRISSWQSVVDLSPERSWCDNPTGSIAGNIDYAWSVWTSRPLPMYRHTSGDINWPAGCGVETNWPNTWHRDGFVPSSHPATLDPKRDVPYWIANPMGGVVKTDKTGDSGNRLPTYCGAGGAGGCGNMGNNVARGFYCTGGGSVTPDWCDLVDTGFTYFFARNQPGFQPDCDDAYSIDYRAANPGGRIGCRDASVVTWDNPESASPTGQAWTACPTGSSGPHCTPDRVRAKDILNFRFYCLYDASGTRCINPGYGSANSSIYGHFMAPFNADCPTCTGGVTIYGVTARLVQ